MGAQPITIVGGGLAGLSLGIGLRQRNIPVTIWEAGCYPRHRVCGEFICGRGLILLEQLGLLDLFLRAGARPAETTAFFLTHKSFPIRPLPSPALCLPRHAMDQTLAGHFQQSGGELRTNTRWQRRSFGEGIVCANGRQLHPVERGWRWFGLKSHATNVHLVADLEMHVSRNGYVGLCRLSGHKVNVCGLFRRRVNNGHDAWSGRDLLRGPEGSLLNTRLATAVFDEESSCAVAGLSLCPQSAISRTDCCIGDALTMIPPVTGNGMSMAFESAEIAVDSLAAYSRGEIPWMETQHSIARRCDEAFGRRLKWAKFLQWLMFTPLIHSSAGSLLMHSRWFWQTLFQKTR